uniref:Uncharacterized protein n=1 Tax=Molossus molossus TaxID=27622 RepID=A0A7J8C909_MOLMO|nr:hypothetical protein HJG59_009968 [Molossus molossus]
MSVFDSSVLPYCSGQKPRCLWPSFPHYLLGLPSSFAEPDHFFPTSTPVLDGCNHPRVPPCIHPAPGLQTVTIAARVLLFKDKSDLVHPRLKTHKRPRHPPSTVCWKVSLYPSDLVLNFLTGSIVEVICLFYIKISPSA